MLNKHNMQGMTIIEIFMTLGIVSVLMTTSLFYLNSDNFRLNSEVRNLRSALTQARAEAVKRNTGIKVDLSSIGYDTVVSSDNSLISGHLLYKGIVLLSQDLETLTTDAISFAAMGTASNAHIKIANSSRNYSVRVNSTGRILIEGPFSGGTQ